MANVEVLRNMAAVLLFKSTQNHMKYSLVRISGKNEATACQSGGELANSDRNQVLNATLGGNASCVLGQTKKYCSEDVLSISETRVNLPVEICSVATKSGTSATPKP